MRKNRFAVAPDSARAEKCGGQQPVPKLANLIHESWSGFIGNLVILSASDEDARRISTDLLHSFGMFSAATLRLRRILNAHLA
jgi:hypothetical protein